MSDQARADQASPEQATEGSEFAQLDDRSVGVFREAIMFLRHNKKWWMMPILIALLLIGVIIVVGSTVGAPFIYTLF